MRALSIWLSVQYVSVCMSASHSVSVTVTFCNYVMFASGVVLFVCYFMHICSACDCNKRCIVVGLDLCIEVSGVAVTWPSKLSRTTRTKTSTAFCERQS